MSVFDQKFSVERSVLVYDTIRFEAEIKIVRIVNLLQMVENGLSFDKNELICFKQKESISLRLYFEF